MSFDGLQPRPEGNHGSSVPSDGATKLPPVLRTALLIAMVAPALTFVTLPPSLPLIADHFGGGAAGTSTAQAAQALSFAGGALGGVLSGIAISLAGLRRTVGGAALLYALGGLIALIAIGPGMLLPGTFLVGLAGSLLSSGLAMATGAELVGEPRARMLGFQAATSDIAGIVVSLVAGFLATLAGWRAPLGIYVTFGIAAFVLVTVARPREVTDVADEPRGMMAALRLAWPVYAAGTLFSLLIATQQLQLPFHLQANGVATAADRAIVQTFTTGAAAAASLTFGLTRARLGERLLLLVGGAAGALGLATFAMWEGGIMVAATAAALVGVAIGLSVPLLFTQVLKMTPPGLHGYAVGLLNTTIFLGGALNPLVFAPAIKFGGATAAFWTASIVAIVAAGVIATRFGRRKEMATAG